VIAKVQPSKRKSRSSFKRLLNYLTMERDPDTGKTLLRGDVVMSHNLVGTCLKDLTTFVADKIPPAISTVTVAPAPAAAAPAATTHGYATERSNRAWRKFDAGSHERPVADYADAASGSERKRGKHSGSSVRRRNGCSRKNRTGCVTQFGAG